MPQFAWRLVRPLQSFAYRSVLPSAAAGKYHDKGDRVIYGWSSSEVAFLSMLELTGAHAPAQLVREKLLLPSSSNKIMGLSELLASGIFEKKDLPSRTKLSRLMKRKGLLGIWLASELMPSEQILILNPDAHEFSEVKVVASRSLSEEEIF